MAGPTLAELEAGFAHVSTESARHQDQRLGIIACREALEAARTGNYGVGAVLVDPGGRIVARGRNSVFFPRFRSDLHAEMVVMNAFEARHPKSEHMRGYTLVTSLEPCPMCLARLLVAGVQTVKFLARDDLAGMVGLRKSFPAAWRRLWRRQAFARADVSEGLRRFALDVFLLNLEACRRRLLSR
jgi:tRNA(Arg) A34 adenosine deaminase TadA